MASILGNLLVSIAGLATGYLVLSLTNPRRLRLLKKLVFLPEPTKKKAATAKAEFRDDTSDDEEGESPKEHAYAEESQNLLSLLYSIAEDQARKEGFVHRSITCNHCGTSPIRGYRYKCSNCVDFDLCESCEALDLHFKTHVSLKIKIPIPPLANPRSALLTMFYPGTEFTSSNLKYDYTDLQKKTHFDQVELEAFYEQFKSLSTVKSEEGGITKEIFEQCLGPLGLEKNLIAERIFAFFDQNNDGNISFPELVCGMSILCKGSLDERIKYAFAGYDIDGDGFISRQELHKMFKAYFHLSMELVRDVVKTMEEGMMESFDDEASKPISASFSAPIPLSNRNESDDEDSKKGKKGKREETASGSLLLPESSRPPTANSSRTPRPPALSRTFSMGNDTSTTPNGARSTSPVSYEDITTSSLRSGRPLSASAVGSIPYYPFPRERLGSIIQEPEEHWPVMEAMSQDAIEEMVSKTFDSAGIPGEDRLSFEDFKKVVESDSNMLAWFEALGSVF